ncbi:unnamed protein product, partial [Trichogramma brassicae]
ISVEKKQIWIWIRILSSMHLIWSKKQLKKDLIINITMMHLLIGKMMIMSKTNKLIKYNMKIKKSITTEQEQIFLHEDENGQLYFKNEQGELQPVYLTPDGNYALAEEEDQDAQEEVNQVQQESEDTENYVLPDLDLQDVSKNRFNDKLIEMKRKDERIDALEKDYQKFSMVTILNHLEVLNLLKIHHTYLRIQIHLKIRQVVMKKKMNVMIEHAAYKFTDDEAFDKTHTPPAPLMTPSEQKLVTLIVSIEKHNPDFGNLVIEALQFKLFRLQPAQEMQMIEL